ncbi:hypothetical protein LCGC14_2622990, partial [marine sediment metagenome]
AAEVIEDVADPEANAASLRSSLLAILRDPLRLASMRAAAVGLGRADAAGQIARWMAAKAEKPTRAIN